MRDSPEQTTIRIVWPLPPSNLTLPHHTVHVWAWDYGCPSDDLRRYITLLSPEEYSRMQRFHFEKDRLRYTVSHAILRLLLGRYLSIEPASIAFEQNEFGKPRLAPDLAAKLDFNMSHTDRIALLAIAAGLKIGIDVEEIRPVERETVEQHFSLQEQSDLATLTGSAWLEGFYNCWTRKEAILKGEGLGLNIMLDAFDVSLKPDAEPIVLGIRPDAGFNSSWHLRHLRPAPLTAVALATNVHPIDVACYRFSA